MDGDMNVPTHVQSLIYKFEHLRAGQSAPASAPLAFSGRARSTSVSARASLPPLQPSSTGSSAVQDIIRRMNAQRAARASQKALRLRTQSEPFQVPEEPAATAAGPMSAPSPKETPVPKPAPQPVPASLPAVATAVPVVAAKVLEPEDEDDSKTLNSEEEPESDPESTTTLQSTDFKLVVPRSPSSFSTASTGSLDSLLNSLDSFLPELLLASGEVSVEAIKDANSTARHTRRSSLPEILQRPMPVKQTPSALMPSRRASISGKSRSAATKAMAVPTAVPSRRASISGSRLTAPKAVEMPVATSRRSSLRGKSAVPAVAKARRSSISTTNAPSFDSTRRFTQSARGAPPIVITSPRASTTRNRSDSTPGPVPRYLDYDHSPRYAATKAMNIERRRLLEERSRNLAADKVKHLNSKTARRPRSPDWQGRLDQVRSRLFDSQDEPQRESMSENQSRIVKPKATAARVRHEFFDVQKPTEAAKTTVEAQLPGAANDGIVVPRLPLSELTWKNRARFVEMMERHSFVVLSELGETLERAHERVLADFETFFTSADAAWKNGCTSKHVYRNENNTPMWYCGYEHTSVRDCFRVACGDMTRLVWPSPEFQAHWLALQRRMQRICDRALSLTMGYDIAPSHERPDVDFSVCYGLHYPNIEGSGQSEAENVFEHVDPSLYVVEPVPSVEGLDVFDQHSKQWLKAEKVCVPGKEIVLFCGKALQRATKGRIPGTLHRVRRTPDRRFCIIYEQKYEEYFL
ncbi:hypothetical protein BBJ28_00000213 [Nothophytophthora sp. Chile5]|nr:hypothetical protein BBJ28_00000213 [Nothophytophthora sp. Chile5]